MFGRILNERVKAITDVKVMDEQGGFRAGRGCNDQIFVVKQIVEKTTEKNKKTYMAFLDLEKAYDNREKGGEDVGSVGQVWDKGEVA